MRVIAVPGIRYVCDSEPVAVNLADSELDRTMQAEAYAEKGKLERQPKWSMMVVAKA